MQKSYISRQQNFFPRLTKKVNSELGIIVVIPSYNEPDLITTLNSLHEAKKPKCAVEVIVVLNGPVNASQDIINQNLKTYEDFKSWLEADKLKQSMFNCILEVEMPIKHAGVGLARKIGMDEAIYRFEKVDNKEGIIACFDADSRCQQNYFVELEKHFNNHPESPACSINFEHPLFENGPHKDTSEAIIAYELHLRYYKQALSYIGFPYAFHSIGSSMAVRSSAYQKQGGMNKRKAGEDFYFLHKIALLGEITELNSTTIIPSPRPSNRVPFGTGKSIINYFDNKKNRPELTSENYTTYNLQSFLDLEKFLRLIPKFYQLDEVEIKKLLNHMPQSVFKFLTENDFVQTIAEIESNSASHSQFTKKVHQWFNGFKALKFIHFARDHFYSDCSVFIEAKKLLKLKGIEVNYNSCLELLKVYRHIDKQGVKK